MNPIVRVRKFVTEWNQAGTLPQLNVSINFKDTDLFDCMTL